MNDEITFVDEDVTEVLNNMVTLYEAVTDRKLFPADPVRLFLLSIAQIIVQQRVLINLTSRGNLLRYANGANLDAMGEFTETKRLEADAAMTTLEFRLSMPLLSSTIIPAGTRVGVQGAEGSLYFSTKSVLEIPSGQLSGQVTAECTVAGSEGNGFLPGQINVLIDPLPFIQSVSNKTASSGGAERESDDAYRNRIRSAPESFSTAGPAEGYHYWAKSASSSIVDVGVDNPSDGVVIIVPLMANGELPSQEVLEAVSEAVNDRKRRPLTDKVTVQKPTIAEYGIDFTYWVSRERTSDLTTIQTDVSQAVDQYRTWQKSKLGRSINPSELISRVMAAGASRVNVMTPVYTEVGRLQVAQDTSLNVVFGGISDD